MKRDVIPRFAWCLTGSGHYLRESLDIIFAMDGVDLFLTRAGEEVLNMYGHPLKELKDRIRVFRDNTASSAPVGLLYHGHYHTVVVAPATSNTVAKCVQGISDTLVTNIFAQAGKVRIPSIVFACDTEPVVITESPGDWVTLFPRQIDLENTERLRAFEYTTVVSSVEDLKRAIDARVECLSTSSS